VIGQLNTAEAPRLFLALAAVLRIGIMNSAASMPFCDMAIEIFW
jgi:hypothetical protein